MVRDEAKEFRKAHGTLAIKHDHFLAAVFTLSDQIVDEVLRCTHLAAVRPVDERGEGTFLFAFQMLASKVVSHVESVRTLVRIARYGDASTLIRGLIGDATMIEYLALEPNATIDWCKLAKVNDPRPPKGSALAKLKAKFNDGVIRRAISRLGGATISNRTYGIYSEPVHSSLWGMKFFSVQEPGRRANFSVTYRPIYQGVAAFRCVATAAALAVDVVDSFYSWASGQNLGSMVNDLRRWREIRPSVSAQLHDAFEWLETSHVKLYGDPRVTTADGESTTGAESARV